MLHSTGFEPLLFGCVCTITTNVNLHNEPRTLNYRIHKRSHFYFFCKQPTTDDTFYCIRNTEETLTHTDKINCDISVVIATGLQAGWPMNRDSIHDRGKRFVLFFTAFGQALGPSQPPTQLVPGTVYPGIKRPRREANTSIQCRGWECWSYASISPYHLRTQCFIT
jgi:hypothetical protein